MAKPPSQMEESKSPPADSPPTGTEEQYYDRLMNIFLSSSTANETLTHLLLYAYFFGSPTGTDANQSLPSPPPSPRI